MISKKIVFILNQTVKKGTYVDIESGEEWSNTELSIAFISFARLFEHKTGVSAIEILENMGNLAKYSEGDE